MFAVGVGDVPVGHKVWVYGLLDALYRWSVEQQNEGDVCDRSLVYTVECTSNILDRSSWER